VEELAEAVREATGEAVELAYVEQGYTGEKPADAAEEHGIRLEVVKRPEAKRGFVLLPRRWVVERDLAWASRLRRLVKDYERLPATVAGCTSSLWRASSSIERSPYSSRVYNIL
jgi:transposase